MHPRSSLLTIQRVCDLCSKFDSNPHFQFPFLADDLETKAHKDYFAAIQQEKQLRENDVSLK